MTRGGDARHERSDRPPPADAEVARYLAGVLEQHDDGTVPKTHQVVLGELWTGVLAAGDVHDPDNPRRSVIDTAGSLDTETIETHDASGSLPQDDLYAEISMITSLVNGGRPGGLDGGCR
jgi:hypothetical protein